ncbi:hypothetical protein PSTT_03680 [Puccinia striiformis]|uniref:DUF2428 domain-containing protein n=1 Tax=Puccinia striiformis TaxID=27350 RepID=A0A2S4VVF7_9BASI|nr:hypothetical protein PSTT_03680 [Puccinia striiformis]
MAAIKLLEELKAQLTQPAKKPLEAGATGHLHVGRRCKPSEKLIINPIVCTYTHYKNILFCLKKRWSSTIKLVIGTRSCTSARGYQFVFRKLKSTKRNSISSDSNSLPPEVLRQISRGIWVHWNAPSPTISYKIKNALKNLLEYMNNSRSRFPTSVKQSILLEKRSLSILSYLLPHLSSADALQAFQLFSASPREFLATILDAIADDKLASVVGQLAVHWTTKVEGWDLNISQPTNCSTNIHSNWISIVFSILFSSQERKRQYLCQYYLLPLFKNRPRCFTEIAGTLSLITGPRFDRLSLTDNPFDHLSGIIALARLNPRQSCSRSESNSHNGPWLPDTLLKVSLSHPAVSLRSSALAIICQSLAPTSRLSLPHLDLVLQFFTWNFEFSEAVSDEFNDLFAYRCQMASLTYLQILLNTGVDSLYDLPTKKPCLNNAQEGHKPLNFPFEIEILDSTLINDLILALTSTYVDVLAYAMQCLDSNRESENSTASFCFCLHYYYHGISISVERPIPLADDLEDRITESEINLGKACEERPVSGSIMLISELYKCLTTEMITSLVESKDLKAIMDQTKNLILRVWKLSAIVLCHSSERESEIIPDHEEARAYEFISAEEDGELLEDEGVLSDRNLGHRHKTILSACWRSMKEASALLMQTVKLSLMAEEQNLSENLGTFFSYEDLKQIGELFEQWLLEIRHRGAFGAIHASYSSLCDSLCSLPKKSIPSQLPVIWLQAHISAITSRKISTTRRSAGLPYCILSTCQALSKSNTNKLRDSLSTILSLAESQEISSEVQVHILNTLKILLTDGKSALNSLQLSSKEASTSLSIPSRNGALILFSGLTNRVFGTRSLSSDRCFNNLCKRESLSDFSRRLPTMLILLKELRRSIQAGTHLLSTSHSHGPISIGADAMTGLIPCSQVPALICDLLTEAMKSPCHNQVHGLLLLINRLIQLPSTLSEDEKSKIQANLDSSASKFLHSKAIPLVTQSSFLEIIESLETRFNIKAEPTCLLTSDTMMDKVQEYRRIRAPALNSYETQATRHLLQRTQDREMVLRLLRVGSTATLITVFEFLGKAENRAILNDPEIIDVIFRFGRQSTHSISIRLPALKLLTIGSDLKAVSWPLEEIFMDYESSLAIPMRDTLLVLSGYFLVNSLGDPDSNHDNLSVRIWADKILDKIEGAAHEDQSTETRLSAVEGLTAFLKLFKSDDGVLSMKIKYRTLQLSISLIQDDDDEIRSSLTNNLDQLFQPSDDLFVTERLNLYKDDFLDSISLEILNSNAEPDGELNAEEVKAEQDQKINQVFEDAELGQEIQTFKHLLDVLIPVSLAIFQMGTILFRNLLNKRKAESENDNEGKDEFNVISYKAWHSLILRLFNLIKIFQSFPRKSQHSILSSMVMLDNDDPSSVADISSLIQAQAQELDDRFLCLRNFLSSHY